jgi:hypothetical protein
MTLSRWYYCSSGDVELRHAVSGLKLANEWAKKSGLLMERPFGSLLRLDSLCYSWSDLVAPWQVARSRPTSDSLVNDSDVS